MDIDKKSIAKNTIYLYVRFIFVLLVNLYSSRILLEELGVTDFSLYNTVFSVVGFLSFLSSTLSTSTSRFITFELGAGNKNKLQITYSTTWFAHILLSLFILILAESIGLWYVCNIMMVSVDRFAAALFVYQISIFVTIISILQIPFTSTIVAHESMSAYAYIGVFEALSKLAIAIFLVMGMGDKLILYAILSLFVSIAVCLAYMIYAKRHFSEISFSLKWDAKILKKIIGFSGWNIMANVSNVLSTNVVILLFNTFFAPVVVASQTIASQVYNGLNQLTHNVRAAVNPQIIKLYADGNFLQSRNLTISSAEFLFDISMITCIPTIVVSQFILELWLVEVPTFSVVFTQLMLLQAVLETFNASYYTPMLASNKIAKNSILGLILSVIQVVILYILFYRGFGPLWARYIGILIAVIFSWIVKPIILCRDIDYPVKQIVQSLFQCLKKLICVAIPSILVYLFVPQDNFMNTALSGLLSLLFTVLVVLAMMSKSKKDYIKNIILTRFGNK